MHVQMCKKIISKANFYHENHFYRLACFKRAKTPGGATETEQILTLRPAVNEFYNFFHACFQIQRNHISWNVHQIKPPEWAFSIFGFAEF
jgi:hypothetical protein